jgi:ribosome biogenesis GTPase A
MDKIQLLQKLSEELSSKSIYEDFSRNIAVLRSDNLRLGILGQPNTAKTTLINGLIGSSLPVSNLPSKTSYSITFGDDVKDTFSGGTNKLAQEISINSDWLKNNRIAISVH